jgi:lysophospholipase L1-like esterase
MARAATGVLAALLLSGAVVAITELVSSGGAPGAHQRAHSPTSTTTPPAPPPQPTWRVAWGSAMAWGYGTARDATARELATVGVGGDAVRVRISNLFGNVPLVVGAASVGRSAGGPAVVAGTLQPLRFGGQPTVTVPVGGEAYSDPVAMSVSDGETLAVSLFVPSSELVTVHPCCTSLVSYASPNGSGDLTGSTSGTGLSVASPWERWVDAVDVLQTTGEGSIVVIGDSITDGYNATTNWAALLQQRIDALPASQQRAVVNEAITANALTSVVHTYSAVGGGPSGLSRLAEDALDQPGTSEVVLFIGTNDLWFGASAEQLIQGYQQAIAAVHQAGLRVVGVTLLPRGSNPIEHWSPAQQAALEQVDQWILTSGAFDGVLDLAPAVADVYDGACNPTALYPPFDSGDHLHPNTAGQTAMADAVDPSVLELPALPQLPQVVHATPTPGCDSGPP